MAGIGKYKKPKELKEVKFELKSGNNPSFTQMGSSPLEMSRKSWEKNVEMRKEEDERWDDPGDTQKPGSPGPLLLSKGVKIGISALTGGLDAVYGSGKVKFGTKKKDDDEGCDCDPDTDLPDCEGCDDSDDSDTDDSVDVDDSAEDSTEEDFDSTDIEE